MRNTTAENFQDQVVEVCSIHGIDTAGLSDATTTEGILECLYNLRASVELDAANGDDGADSVFFVCSEAIAAIA